MKYKRPFAPSTMPCLTKLMKLHRLLTLKIVELLVQDKAKLVELVPEDYDRFGP